MWKDLIYNIIIIYIIISFFEWFIHKYIMHGNPDVLIKIPLIGKYFNIIATEHKQHHKDILMNMHYIKDGLTNGFFWFETIILIILMFFMFKILTNIKSNKNIFIITVCICIIYSFLWNTIHNKMHYTTETIKIKQGVPSIILDSSIIKNPIYKFLYINHGIHHLQKGEKYNFNIILPMFDDIFFTKKYGKCYNNVPYCKLNKHLDKRCNSKIIGCINIDDKK